LQSVLRLAIRENSASVAGQQKIWDSTESALSIPNPSIATFI
jgi:hypothetical protein